jgi:hypothetical protein
VNLVTDALSWKEHTHAAIAT